MRSAGAFNALCGQPFMLAHSSALIVAVLTSVVLRSGPLCSATRQTTQTPALSVGFQLHIDHPTPSPTLCPCVQPHLTIPLQFHHEAVVA